MTERLDRYATLAEKDGTKEERTRLLKEMTDEEIDYLISHAGNQSARIYYAGFKKA